MAKNIVRKSLSILSASVLGASVLVAAPAAYATQLKLEPSAGTLYAVPHNTDITLRVSANPGFSSSELAFLKFRLETAGGIDLRAVAGQTDSTAATISDSVVVADTATSAVLAGSVAANGAAGFVALYATKADGTDFAVTDANVTATVKAFIDKNANNVLDSGEWVAEQVVTWVDSDNLSLNFSVVQPVLNANAAIVARLTSTQVNIAQSTGTFRVDFTGPNSSTSIQTGVTGSYQAAPLDRAQFSSTAVTATNGEYAAQLKIGSTNIVRAARTVSTSTVTAVEGTMEAGKDNESAIKTDSAKSIRVGSGSLSYDVVVLASTTPVVGKNITLTVSETSPNGIAAAATISVGGQTLRNASVSVTEDITVTAVSDANGEASFSISWSGLGTATSNQSFSVSASVDGRSSTTLVLTTAPAAATTVYSADVQATSEQVVTAVGATTPLTFHLLDQFGQLFTTAGYSVTATSGGATAAGPFNNGIATLTFPAFNAAAAGAKPLTISVSNTINGSNPAGSTAQFTLFVGAPAAPSSIDIGGTFGTAASPSALNVNRTADADVRAGSATFDPTVSSEIATTATVRDVNGNAVRSRVTFSSPNLIFRSASGIYKKGSITVWTNGDGVASVNVSSQNAGAQVLTVTAGSATKTQNIVFAAAAANTGTRWTFSVPTSATPGSTFRVTGTLTDRFGNPVRVTRTADISVSYNGPGLVSGSLPNTTDATGQFSFWVLVGANDRGTATVTASYDRGADGDFTGTNRADLDVVASTTITIGAGPVSTTGTVNVGSFNGKLVVYAKNLDGKRISWKVGGNWGKATAVGNTLNRFDRPTPRRGVTVSVQIYVDGVLQLTKSVVTR